ncbi:MAG: hypothetical protein EOO63_05070 [Hymenobacter sp.]|nr:MAG: hypothetical protein EOO63_05070 [Hymenobacter sp.]
MKFSHLLLAAGLCSFGVASAQTTPTSTQPTRGTGSAAPSAVPSGTAPVTSEPRGNVSAGEVFTKGSAQSSKGTMKSKKDKDASRGKMKSKM